MSSGGGESSSAADDRRRQSQPHQFPTMFPGRPSSNTHLVVDGDVERHRRPYGDDYGRSDVGWRDRSRGWDSDREIRGGDRYRRERDNEYNTTNYYHRDNERDKCKDDHRGDWDRGSREDDSHHSIHRDGSNRYRDGHSDSSMVHRDQGRRSREMQSHKEIIDDGRTREYSHPREEPHLGYRTDRLSTDFNDYFIGSSIEKSEESVQRSFYGAGASRDITSDVSWCDSSLLAPSVKSCVLPSLFVGESSTRGGSWQMTTAKDRKVLRVNGSVPVSSRAAVSIVSESSECKDPRSTVGRYSTTMTSMDFHQVPFTCKDPRCRRQASIIVRGFDHRIDEEDLVREFGRMFGTVLRTHIYTHPRFNKPLPIAALVFGSDNSVFRAIRHNWNIPILGCKMYITYDPNGFLVEDMYRHLVAEMDANEEKLVALQKDRSHDVVSATDPRANDNVIFCIATRFQRSLATDSEILHFFRHCQPSGVSFSEDNEICMIEFETLEKRNKALRGCDGVTFKFRKLSFRPMETIRIINVKSAPSVPATTTPSVTVDAAPSEDNSKVPQEEPRRSIFVSQMVDVVLDSVVKELCTVLIQKMRRRLVDSSIHQVLSEAECRHRSEDMSLYQSGDRSLGRLDSLTSNKESQLENGNDLSILPSFMLRKSVESRHRRSNNENENENENAVSILSDIVPIDRRPFKRRAAEKAKLDMPIEEAVDDDSEHQISDVKQRPSKPSSSDYESDSTTDAVPHAIENISDHMANPILDVDVDYLDGQDDKDDDDMDADDSVDTSLLLDLIHGRVPRVQFDEEEMRFLQDIWVREVGQPEFSLPQLDAVEPFGGCSRSEPYERAIKAKRIRWVPRLEDRIDSSLGASSTDQSKNRHARMNRVNNRVDRRSVHASVGSGDTSLLEYNALKSRQRRIKFDRSEIHKWGLFALEPFEVDDFVAEYVGEVVRVCVADNREKGYEKQGIGSSYLFRIDDDFIVDATRRGSLARFLNHSCDPTCYARIINVSGEKKIVIYAKKPVAPGEELTYDYKFDYEDDEDKISCLCGAAKCRGSLN